MAAGAARARAARPETASLSPAADCARARAASAGASDTGNRRRRYRSRPSAGGYYLQLGAFGSKENAENFLARMRAQVDWLADTLHVFARDGLFRVHAGPYPNQADARATAERVNQSLGLKPVVLTR